MDSGNKPIFRFFFFSPTKQIFLELGRWDAILLYSCARRPVVLHAGRRVGGNTNPSHGSVLGSLLLSGVHAHHLRSFGGEQAERIYLPGTLERIRREKI